MHHENTTTEFDAAHLAAINEQAQGLTKRQRQVVEALLQWTPARYAELDDWGSRFTFERHGAYCRRVSELAEQCGCSVPTIKKAVEALPRDLVSTEGRRWSVGKNTDVFLLTADERAQVHARQAQQAVAEALNEKFGTEAYGNTGVTGHADGLAVSVNLQGLSAEQAERLLAVYAELKAELPEADDED